MQLDKLTEERQSEQKRSYDDACGTAHALDLIGERLWGTVQLQGISLFLGIMLALPVGIVLWSFMEYVLHRFAFHEARGEAERARFDRAPLPARRTPGMRARPANGPANGWGRNTGHRPRGTPRIRRETPASFRNSGNGERRRSCGAALDGIRISRHRVAERLRIQLANERCGYVHAMDLG